MTSRGRGDTGADGATDAALPPGAASDLGASQPGHHDTAHFDIGEIGQPSPVSEPGQFGQNPDLSTPDVSRSPSARGHAPTRSPSRR
jgi:hypothetical protein